MTSYPAIDALTHAVSKRQLLSKDQSKRLGGMLSQNGTTDLVGIRQWLEENRRVNADLVKSMEDLLPKQEGLRFNQYNALAHLAEGGMGTLWLAVADDSAELVVVKALRKNLAQSEEFVLRFQRETDIMMTLEHPGLVKCLDRGQSEDGTLFMVLELVPYGTLKDLAKSRPADEITALQILFQVTEVLAEAHNLELVHRDIKPENIFASKDGRAKLSDFGLARSTNEERTSLTMQGAMVGTPLYMSPEQIMGDSGVGIHADIYGLGGVLYFALTGRDPFQGKMHEVMHAHQTAPPPKASAQNASISPETDAIIVKAMAKKPADRFATPADMNDAIEKVLNTLGSQAISSEEANRRVTDGDASESVTREQAREELESLLVSTKPHVRGQEEQGGSSIINNGTTPAGDNLAATVVQNPGDASSVSEESYIGTSWPSVAGSDALTASIERGGPSLIGDLDKAMSHDWISLSESQGSTLTLLYARQRLCLGKMREPPVDISLRNYPVNVHKVACQRVSRQHLAVAYNEPLGTVQLQDLGSGNGTVFNGQALPPNAPQELTPGPEHIVVAAGTISLHLRNIANNKGSQHLLGLEPSVLNHPCGIERDHKSDAIIFTRPENRPELSYAMVLRRMTIGGIGSDLALAGSVGTDAIEIGRYNGRWIWRRVDGNPHADWIVLLEGTQLNCAGKSLTALPAHYGCFR